MYVPSHFAQEDRATLLALIGEFPLATLVTPLSGSLEANHLPLIAEERDGGLVLCGHLARGNPAWRGIDGKDEALAIFQGPSAYVSPSWYPSKAEHGKAVPTYNYAAVHAYGHLRLVTGPAALHRHLGALTARFEATREPPWQIDEAPADYLEKMIAAVVGVEITVTRLVGKWKASQNRDPADRLGVRQGLQAQGDDASRAMAGLIPGA